MTQALDRLDKYLAESAQELDVKQPDEFTVQDYIEMIYAKHGRVVPNPNARYQLNKDVKEGKLKHRRISFDGKFANVYSVITPQTK